MSWWDSLMAPMPSRLKQDYGDILAPEGEQVRAFPEEVSAWLHGALAVVGMIPAVGTVAGSLDTACYVIEGNWAMAGLSAAVMIPIFGTAVSVAKGTAKIPVSAAKRVAAQLGSPRAGSHAVGSNARMGWASSRWGGEPRACTRRGPSPGHGNRAGLRSSVSHASRVDPGTLTK